jgi:pimeloyl-ACP methyl ester carboxylesterase
MHRAGDRLRLAPARVRGEAERSGGVMGNRGFVAVWVCMGFVAPVVVRAQPEPAPRYTEPLGIALEGWPYPYPVGFHRLEAEGQLLRMAYMDMKVDRADAPAVVLLHGKNFFGAYWEETIRALTAAGYRVVVPDQIGFGKSSKPDIHYSFDLMAAQTASLLDHLRVKRAAIVGHSMGGMLAVRFARNYPERTTKLVLEDPIGLEDYRMAVPPAPTDVLFRQELEKSPEALRKYIAGYFVTWKPEYEKLVEPHVRVTLSGEYARWAKSSALTYEMIYQQPVRHEFSLIRAPTLLVIGLSDRTAIGKDRVVPEVADKLGNYPELGKAAAKDIPGAKLVEIENVGHIPHLEAPEKFHEALVGFLRGP